MRLRTRRRYTLDDDGSFLKIATAKKLLVVVVSVVRSLYFFSLSLSLDLGSHTQTTRRLVTISRFRYYYTDIYYLQERDRESIEGRTSLLRDHRSGMQLRKQKTEKKRPK